MTKYFPVLLIALCFFARGSFAAIEELEFASEDHEARYHVLINEMRCPMCLNANLAGSDAPIAADLRAEIYKQIEEGRSSEEITAFMRERYGDFIIYRPPVNKGTAILWFGPGVLLVLGFFILRRLLASSRSSAVQETLSAEELQKLSSILDDGKEHIRS